MPFTPQSLLSYESPGASMQSALQGSISSIKPGAPLASKPPSRQHAVELLMAVAQARPHFGCASDDFFGSSMASSGSRDWYSDPHAPTRGSATKPKRSHATMVSTLSSSPELELVESNDLSVGVRPLGAVKASKPKKRSRTSSKASLPRTNSDGTLIKYKMQKKKPFACDFCAASFMSELQRSKHHNAHNKGRLSHICDICQVAVSNVTIHLRIHTNSRPFKCPHCTQAFTVSGSLNRHLRTHSGARPYKCPECPKACSSSSDLKKHLRIHTGERPYKCHLCTKAFTVSGSLKNHLRTHTGERPYRCNQCTQSFTRLGDLKNHRRAHSGKRSHSCPECSKSFSKPGSLKAHMRTHRAEGGKKTPSPSPSPSTSPPTPTPTPTHTPAAPAESNTGAQAAEAEAEAVAAAVKEELAPLPPSALSSPQELLSAALAEPTEGPF